MSNKIYLVTMLTLFCPGTEGRKRAQERKLNYSTKMFEGVPIIVKGQYKPPGTI